MWKESFLLNGVNKKSITIMVHIKEKEEVPLKMLSI